MSDKFDLTRWIRNLVLKEVEKQQHTCANLQCEIDGYRTRRRLREELDNDYGCGGGEFGDDTSRLEENLKRELLELEGRKAAYEFLIDEILCYYDEKILEDEAP